MSSNVENSKGEEIRFLSEGISAATLFRPPAPSKNGAPGVLMAHGFAAVRSMSNIPEVVKRLLAAEITRQSFERAGQPKKLVTYEGTHYARQLTAYQRLSTQLPLPAVH